VGLDYCHFCLIIPPRDARYQDTILAVKVNKLLVARCKRELNIQMGTELKIRGRLVNNGAESLVELLATKIDLNPPTNRE
jgi:hypothetical protein